MGMANVQFIPVILQALQGNDGVRSTYSQGEDVHRVSRVNPRESRDAHLQIDFLEKSPENAGQD